MSPLYLTDERFPIVVDYSVPLPDLIGRGNFHRASAKINPQRFPIQGTGQHKLDVQVVAMDANADLPTSGVLEWMKASGLRPLKLEELLFWAASLQKGRLDRVACPLGSIWQDEQGAKYAVSCQLSADRRLRFSQIHTEPYWSGAWYCFPCCSAA